ncbi:MAG: hypothetical protein ABL921_28335 [Pirellula sp.]
MRFGIAHLLVLMAMVAIVGAFVREFPIVILFPPVFYGSMFASRAARRFDASIDRTMIIGGLSTCLTTLAFSFPFFMNAVHSRKKTLSGADILFSIFLIAFVATLLGMLIGLFWDIVHLFTTHSKTDFRSGEIDADSIEY